MLAPACTSFHSVVRVHGGESVIGPRPRFFLSLRHRRSVSVCASGPRIEGPLAGRPGQGLVGFVRRRT